MVKKKKGFSVGFWVVWKDKNVKKGRQIRITESQKEDILSLNYHQNTYVTACIKVSAGETFSPFPLGEAKQTNRNI